MESQITVARTSPLDIRDRQVIVKLNGEEFATLMYGQTATGAVEPGRYQMRLDNTWNKTTVEFDLAPGEHARFLTINRMGRFTWFIAAFFGIGPIYVSVEREA